MGVNSVYRSNSALSTYGSKGMSGLMSGMDVDEIVKGMTMGTTGKIAKQLQSKQILSWKSEAYRSISSPLIDFANNYTSFTSSTNLMSAAFFSKSSITASGTNSKYVSVTGKSNSADYMQILGVKQLAKDATQSLTGGATGAINTDVFDLSDANSKVNNVAGQTLTVKYGGQTIDIELKESITPDPDNSSDLTSVKTLEYDTWENTLKSINYIISKDPDIPADFKGKVKFEEAADGKLKFSFTDPAENNNFEIKSGTKNLLTALGLKGGDKITSSQKEYTSTTAMGTLIENVYVTDKLANKSMSFTYNGVTKSIKLGTASELNAMSGDDFAAHVQGKLDEAFGQGRVQVNFKSSVPPPTPPATAPPSKKGSLEIKTVKPVTSGGTTTYDDDNSSVIKISTADSGLLGKTGVFGIYQGSSNRVNTNVAIENSGLKGVRDGGVNKMETIMMKDEKGNLYEGYAISVNGKEIKLKATDSIGEMMNKINNANAGVKITYNEVSDTFNLRATDGGASGRIDIKDLGLDANGNLVPANSNDAVQKSNLAAKLFPTAPTQPTPPVDPPLTTPPYKTNSLKDGQDAIIEVDFDGYGIGADPVEITRGSNTFNLDGLNVTVSQEFDSFKKDKDGNYVDQSGVVLSPPYEDASGNETRVVDTENIVKFSAKADADKIVEAVKKMAEDYNKMVDLIQDTMTQKRDRKYPPLTEEQKEEMEEDEIKAWEEKAKAGMLFNDTTLAALANDLRFVFSSYKVDDIASIGISNSGTSGSSYKNNGKITIDENKLRTAIAERPDEVSKLFTANMDTKTITVGGKSKEQVDITTGGVMQRMKAITDKYAATTGATKGILIEKAGHPSAPTSLFSNSLQKEMDMIDKTVDKLKTTLSSEEARYYKQFTRLEQVVAQMNSQSSWFSQMSGGQ